MKLRRKKELLKALGDIPDFRDRKKITYPLNEVLFMTLFCKCGFRFAPWFIKR